MKKPAFWRLALGLLLASASAAQAQTKVKIKTKTDGPVPNTEATAAAAARPQTEQGTGISSVGKIIPVAEYYEGGQAAMYDFISKELRYPLLAKRNRIQGQCIVSFTLNPDGTMSGIKLVKQLGGGTGDEALRVVHLLKFKKPEYPILTSLPINFKLGVTGSNAMN